ncbi:MAG: 23S rRNA (adenine(2503)-C(2))-methyltransferase RlmN, partial [Thermodesulfovibrionales bacterium]|nr:23S rRNA (adenine(2503)-C(2))-methyltransferase RlmN [Thermodesulfovibrionales bacterium]
RITFEYVMLKGINDSLKDAQRLANLIKGIPSKINLIPFNPFEGCQFQGSDSKTILKFQRVLTERNLSVFIRKSRGGDIEAACGQLRAFYSKKVLKL